jgi:hypothetical protein
MYPESITWQRQRKRMVRRLARDFRTLAPLLGVLFCFVSSASAIATAERLPIRTARVVRTAPANASAYLTISSSSTSKLRAAPAGMRPVLRLP